MLFEEGDWGPGTGDWKKMKKYLFILMFFATGFLFSQDIKVYETSNDFTEIMGAFQRRLHNVSREFKYFIPNESPFDFEDGEEGELFDKKAKKTIGNKKYFIFEIYDENIFCLFLVNREDSKTIAFFLINQRLGEAIECSDAEIDKALSTYQEEDW
ncbi:MAG: hypothetical protein LBC52_02910 [Treponema sp.]|nr:hypothetical protein [Treponema sp.]